MRAVISRILFIGLLLLIVRRRIIPAVYPMAIRDFNAILFDLAPHRDCRVSP